MPNPRRRARLISRNAKYTVPVSEHAPGADKRLNRRGQVKKKYSVVGGEATSNRIPYSTIAKSPKMKRRRRVVGLITPHGKGKTKIYK